MNYGLFDFFFFPGGEGTFRVVAAAVEFFAALAALDHNRPSAPGTGNVYFFSVLPRIRTFGEIRTGDKLPESAGSDN